MSIFVVLSLCAGQMGEPFGVYSSLPMATLAMVQCEHKHEQCEIWEWQLDGDMVEYEPEYHDDHVAPAAEVAGL